MEAPTPEPVYDPPISPIPTIATARDVDFADMDDWDTESRPKSREAWMDESIPSKPPHSTIVEEAGNEDWWWSTSESDVSVGDFSCTSLLCIWHYGAHFVRDLY